MMILGIWDGHDAGAAIIEKNKILVAINEERITRKKLDVGFPYQSIKSCLKYLSLKPSDIDHIAISTSDFSKTLTRVFTSMKDKYYLIRRRKIYPSSATWQKNLKYRLTEIGSSYPTKKISKYIIKKRLKNMGFRKFDIKIIDHHMAHAANAAFCSNFNKSLTITIDGVGDSLSGSINIFENDELKRISEISCKHSLGIFFEHVTNLLGMRELEDEGKVMALSDFAYEIPDKKNPMLDFFKVNNLNLKTKYSSTRMWKELRKILWHTPPEQFAWMAQKTLEKKLLELFSNAVKETGIKDVAWTGGVASNIKANMKIRHLPEIEKWFVFPHMGDGGLALGAAQIYNFEENGICNYKFDNVYFGPKYSEETIENALNKNKFKYSYEKDIEKHVAELINQNEIVFLFNGRMEFGPRALGNRSILASRSSLDSKNDLNLKIKKRVWYQPFCPSILKEDAEKIFSDYDYPERFMTMGFMVKKEYRKDMAAVTNADGSARPQMVSNENSEFKKILNEIKKKTGIGAVLNTSFNIHGFPIVNTPDEAIEVMRKTENKYMAIGKYFVEL